MEPEMEVDMFIEPHPAITICGFMAEEQRMGTSIQLLKLMYGNVDAAIIFPRSCQLILAIRMARI